MSSETEIANLALVHIGVTRRIANLETESSHEAKAIRSVFDTDRKAVLRAFPWPFATSYAELGLVDGSSTTPVNYDWQYSYRYPSDCLFARRIVTATGRRDAEPPPFRIGRDDQGRLIYTDQADAQIEYTAEIDDVEEFDPLAVDALAWKIASSVGMGLSKIKDIHSRCEQMFMLSVSQAQAAALNEGQQTEQVAAELIRARD